MKKQFARSYSTFSVVLCAVLLTALAAGCAPRMLPQAATATPTASPTEAFVPTLLNLPDTGGEPIQLPADPVPVSPPGEQSLEATELRQAELAADSVCDGPFGCSRLGITQAGQVSQVAVTDEGVTPIDNPSLLPREQPGDNRWKVDTGVPSPDGRWIAFTSIGYESGGPVFLQQVETGEWTNVIETINILLPEGRSRLAEEWMWDVIGWFPDSQRLMIGPYDLSFVAVVELSTFTARIIPFPGGGRGGRAYVNLAPDGSLFIYIGESASGTQTLNAYNLTSGNSTLLRELPFDQGIFSNPRLSPDGKTLAYMRQHADLSAGNRGEMELFSLETGAVKSLVTGSLWMAIPNWAPDGDALAFTLVEQDLAAQDAKNSAPAAVQGDVWIVSAGDGTLTQITALDGLARSPAWSPDGKSLAFVTHDGQVGLASVEQPGLVRLAAGPSPEMPELTSVYFIP